MHRPKSAFSLLQRSPQDRRRSPLDALRRLPVEAVIASLERKRLQGDRGVALQIARTLVAAVPRSGKAQRYLARTLVTPPTSAIDIQEARAVADVMISLWEDSAVQREFIDVLIAQHAAGIDQPSPDVAATSFALTRPESRLPAFRRYVVYVLNAGESDRAAVLAFELAGATRHSAYVALSHEIALRAARADLVAATEQLVDELDLSEDEIGLTMVAHRLSSSQQHTEALDVLRSIPPIRTSAYSKQLTSELRSVGANSDIIDYLDNTRHSLNTRDAVAIRAEALLLLGQTREAADLIDSDTDAFTELRMFRLLRDCLRDVTPTADDELRTRIQEYELDAPLMGRHIENAAQLYFEIDRLDDVVRLSSQLATSWRVGVLGRYTLALTHYARRDFPSALALLDGLRATIRGWEAQKLRARILFEQGDDAGAIALRQQSPRHDGTIDEVIYHALLHLGRYEDAFRQYLSAADWRCLESTFGSMADDLTTLRHVPRRAVISQDGPGDELQYAGLLPILRGFSDELIVTCDPRLEALMRRSFPDVDFVPVERLRSRAHSGFLAVDRPPRAQGPLFSLLTVDANERAADTESVVLGRSLPLVSLHREGAPGGYLRADPGLREEFETRIPVNGRPTVGVVWRSEYGSAMRGIHYLTVEQMSPILELECDIVVLQHDLTASERSHLELVVGDRCHIVDDIDLRDDFEQCAALLTRLDAVVGVGTTMVELAGGLGVRTILMHPTRFGTWRASGDDNHDYWHRNTTVVGADHVDHPGSCARNAAQHLCAIIGS